VHDDRPCRAGRNDLTGAAQAKKPGLFKRLLDSRFVWDRIIGPYYNARIGVAVDLHKEFLHAVGARDGARVLDVGCGPGHAAIRLARETPTAAVVGVDFSGNQIAASRRLLAAKALANCRFLEADAMALPFEDGSFDVVMSLASLKHWPDKERGLREIRRVLTGDGYAVVADADSEARADDIDRFSRLFLGRTILEGVMRRFLRQVVVRESLSRAAAVAAAEAAGFRDISIAEIPGWPVFLMRLRP
jgi:ubiquinone/menaquinone biosynthesis C-methylase UbiE